MSTVHEREEDLMQKRIGSTTIAVTLVTALCLAGTASAQAPLQLSIDPTQGIRGDIVNAQVNPDDVAANCITDVAGIQAAFNELYGQIVQEAFVQMYFPDYPGVGICDPECENYEQYGWTAIALLDLGISFGFPPGAAETALANHFALTFADIATQQPVGEVSTFDPNTGMGSVTVPDITPGQWAVAAACVVPAFDQYDAAVQAAAAKAMADNRDLDILCFDPNTNCDTLDWLADNAVELLQPLVTPEALGVQIFTIQTPTLGFTIDPTEGFPGDTVNGQVDTDDIDQYCFDLEEFQARFQELFEGPWVSGNTEGELTQMFFPDPNNIVYENADQVAYVLDLLVILGVAQDPFGSGATEDAFLQSFVMTFADILTQEPLGPLGHFDPTTGEGSVVVPDLDPGLYPVAATCVLPTLDIDALADGVRADGDFLESIGAQWSEADGPISPEFIAWAKDYLGTDTEDPFGILIEFATAVGPDLLQPLVEIRALGVQLYTVLAHLGHFQCYRAHPTVGVGAGTAGSLIPESLPVTLEDRYGVYSGTAHRPVDLCAPADKNGEDPEAPSSPDFLSSYKLSVPGPVEQISGVQAQNQFGSITLNLLQPDTLLVPSAASVEGPPEPGQSFLNDFTCYSVQVGPTKGKGAPALESVTVQTAFETVEVEPGNPRHLCVPASKNGGPVIASAPENLLCYDVKSGNDLKPEPDVFVANQFGQEVQRIGQRRELCVPTDLTD
jgi:hypothetical protein